MDGRLDEPTWSRAAVLNGFSQFGPSDGVPANDSTEVYRSRFSRMERIGDIELQKLAGAKAGDVQEAVVQREVDVRDQRRNRFEPL